VGIGKAAAYSAILFSAVAAGSGSGSGSGSAAGSAAGSRASDKAAIVNDLLLTIQNISGRVVPPYSENDPRLDGTIHASQSSAGNKYLKCGSAMVYTPIFDSCALATTTRCALFVPLTGDTNGIGSFTMSNGQAFWPADNANCVKPKESDLKDATKFFVKLYEDGKTIKQPVEFSNGSKSRGSVIKFVVQAPPKEGNAIYIEKNGKKIYIGMIMEVVKNEAKNGNTYEVTVMVMTGSKNTATENSDSEPRTRTRSRTRTRKRRNSARDL
jgi:hypothetical protein